MASLKIIDSATTLAKITLFLVSVQKTWTGLRDTDLYYYAVYVNGFSLY